MPGTRASIFVRAGLFALVFLLPRPGLAAWPTDPTVNVPICTAAGEQDHPASVSDGAGGAIVTWVDRRNGYGGIYAQRISATGTVLWTADGVALCTIVGNQLAPAIAPDGTGGAIVAWQDDRGGAGYDVYAQRVSAGGAIQWTADGVALCAAAGNQWSPVIAPDGAGGAIVAWQDQRSSSDDDVYAQRISAAGAVQWTADGVALCTAAGWQESLAMTADGAGGAIVAWDDYRAGNYDIYAQKVSAAGAVQWTAGGVAICAAAGGQYSPAIAADSPAAGSGAIVTWFDQRGSDYDVYAQRISPAGTVQWTANGVALCTAAGHQYYPAIVADASGTAIVAWFDQRGASYDIYAQKLSAAGAVQWAANGVALCTAPGTQWYPAIVANGAGGALVAWTDSRNATQDVYAQQVAGDGTVLWGAGGMPVCSAAGSQVLGSAVSDGARGIIAAWADGRSGGGDIYAQRVDQDGNPGTADVPGTHGAAPAFALEPVRPNPARSGSALTVRFALAGDAPAALELLDVAGRRVAAREVGSLGAGPHALDLGEGARLAPGLYLVRLTQGANARVTRVAVIR